MSISNRYMVTMKILKLGKGEAAYIITNDGTTVIVEETATVQNGMRFFLVRSV